MTPKVILIGNSDEFLFSMKLFPEMLQRLLRQRGVEVLLIRPKTIFGKFAPWAGPLGKWLFYVDKFLIFPFVLKSVLWRERAPGLIVHVCDHSNAMYVHRLREVAHLVTCHDMMPMKSAMGEVPQNPTSWTGKCFQRLILRGLKRARFVACVSTASQCDLMRIAGLPAEQTRVIFNSLNHPYTPMSPAEARSRIKARVGVEGPYLLHVGSNSWYKNRLGVFAIYAGLRRRLLEKGTAVMPKLVYAGPSLQREIASLPEWNPEMERDIIFVKGPDNETLRALYSEAELLLFPSWDEGFGWPIIEAQACGCRVVTTNKAPMTEVGGDAAFYIDPHDSPGAAAVVLGILEQPLTERRTAIEKGIVNAGRFTEDRMIADYLEVYHQLIREHCGQARVEMPPLTPTHEQK